jgi:probable rRNA maturation factor
MLMHSVAGGRGFHCLITDDRELRRLNRDFLKNDYPTDVLSFPSGAEMGDLGQIAISGNRAIDQAKAFGHTAEEEVRILMLHGVLHLLGMDHATDHGAMARTERGWRKRLGLPAGLIERARA